MISSKKKLSKRRFKSTSPNRNKNKYYDYNNQKKDNILAIEESKKLYLKFFENPSTTVINQIQGEDLKLNLNVLNLKDISVLSIILSKFFYFKSIELVSSDSKNSKNNLQLKQKVRNIYKNVKEGKNSTVKSRKEVIESRIR